MARRIPSERFARLVELATATFIQRGYRQTQMADIARLLGVAKGTLYGYVESKEALFDAAVRCADGQVPVPQPSALPVKTPAPGATAAYVHQRLADEAAEMTLVRIAQGELLIDEPAAELRAVLGDLYDRLERNRRAIKLVDRCAVDWPELADAWFGQGRWAQHHLLCELLRRRTRDGGYRRLEAVDVVARTLLETVAFWALHRHFDPAPQAVDETQARRSVIDLLVRGVVASQVHS